MWHVMDIEKIKKDIIKQTLIIYNENKKGLSEKEARAVELAIFSTLVIFDNESILPHTLTVTCSETGTENINGDLHAMFCQALEERSSSHE